MRGGSPRRSSRAALRQVLPRGRLKPGSRYRRRRQRLRLRQRRRQRRQDILRVRPISPVCHRRGPGLSHPPTLHKRHRQHLRRTARHQRLFIGRCQLDRPRRHQPPTYRRLRKWGWLRRRRQTTEPSSARRPKLPLANRRNSAPPLKLRPDNKLPLPNRRRSVRRPKLPPGNGLPLPNKPNSAPPPKPPRGNNRPLNRLNSTGPHDSSTRKLAGIPGNHPAQSDCRIAFKISGNRADEGPSSKWPALYQARRMSRSSSMNKVALQVWSGGQLHSRRRSATIRRRRQGQHLLLFAAEQRQDAVRRQSS
jgi:hypothetical protein